MKPRYLASSCLIGKKCRYDGKDQARDSILSLYEQGEILDVCPEELGELPTPRPPAEKVNGKILTHQNIDVSDNYKNGADKALAIALACPSIEKAFLKSKSPMCGCGKIYDGTFTGTLIDGDGVFTDLIKTHMNIPIEPVD